MRTKLTIQDLGGFLDEPRVAVLATIRSDGSVLLSPVWHEWWAGGFSLWTGAQDVKVRHLRRDPRASIVVAESEPPLRGVEVRTAAQIIQDDGVFETAVRIASRYIGERGAGYVRSLGGEDVIVRLVPGDLRMWDFADEHGEMI